ncbi:hypothetical protein [Coraliomargarita parva]|uniref:hypothetical protein n=1 Tax=Coraliomargarita parva TaxID=3014050 RepID=UPI0022B5AB81|nr:hypothetical protein [Coraliomargarita parva]
MAITLEANYSKKLGLPNYSSHQYSVTVRTEVSDLSQVEGASAQLYRQLQEAVDRDIQQTGYLPGEERTQSSAPFQRGGHQGATRQNPANPNSDWNCSPKQRGLIEKLMEEHNIPFSDVDELARHRFRCGLKQLNKMSASGLIDELFSSYATKPKSGFTQRGGRR